MLKIFVGGSMTVGERLKKWRKDSKITMVDISEKTGISQSSISLYEQNKSTMTTKALEQLAKYYDIDINWLITGNKAEENLTAGEKQLLKDYRNCNQEGKAALNATAAALSKTNIDTDTVSKSNHDSPELSTSKTG